MRKALATTLIALAGIVGAAAIGYAAAPGDSRTPHIATATSPETRVVTRTVEVPGPTVQVPGPTVTEQIQVPGPTVEVTPQACKDLVAQLASFLATYSGDWNAWVTSHPNPTVQDYYEITSKLVANGNGAYANLTPLAAACAG